MHARRTSARCAQRYGGADGADNSNDKENACDHLVILVPALEGKPCDAMTLEGVGPSVGHDSDRSRFTECGVFTGVLDRVISAAQADAMSHLVAMRARISAAR